MQCRRCATLSRKLTTTREKYAANKTRNKSSNVKLFQDMRSRLHKEAAKVSAFASNVESVRNLRQERLAADTRALLAETRAENLRLEGEALNSKLKRALRKFVCHII